MNLRINTDGTPDLEAIDYSGPGPYWFVVVDGEARNPQHPLPLPYALHEFERAARDAQPDQRIDVVQCNGDDLELAGVTPIRHEIVGAL